MSSPNRPEPEPQVTTSGPRRASAVRIALGYGVLGAAWVLWSDLALHRLVSDPVLEQRLGVLKGWAFVGVTGLLLGLALDRYFGAIRRGIGTLRESEERWRRALDGAAQAVWDWNVETGTVHYSREWKAMLGYAEDEVGDTLSEWENRVHPEDLPRVMGEVRAHLEGRAPAYASEHRVKVKDGGWRWVLDQGKVTRRSADGRPLRMVGTHADITERRRATEQARIQHDLMLVLASATSVDDGMRECLEAAIRVSGLDSGGFYLWEPATEELVLAVHRGLSAEFVQQVSRYGKDTPQVRAVAAGRAIVVNGEVLGTTMAELRLPRSLRMLAVVPVLYQGRIVGSLNVASHTRGELEAGGLLALETMAAGAGQVILRLQTQEHLRSSEANFRAFFASVDDLIVAAGLDGRILFGNSALQRKLGYTAQELAGMSIADLHPAGLRGEAERIVAAMVRGETAECNLPLRGRDGGEMPVETRAWFGEWDGRKCVFGVSKDVSREKEAQRRFEGLFRHNPLPMALWTLPGLRVADVNEAWLEWMEVSREEALGKVAVDPGLLADAGAWERMIAELLEKGVVRNVDQRLRTRSGGLREALCSAEIHRGLGEEYCLVAMVDITERKRAEAELHERVELQDQLSKVVASVPGMVCSFRLRPDGTACMPFASPAFRDLYDLPPEVVQEDFTPALERIHPEDREPMFRAIRESARELTPWHGVFRVRHDRHGELWVEGQSMPRREPDGGTLWHGFLQDITERKRAEEALRASEERFHAYVEQATDALLVHDVNGRFLEVNRQACLGLGYSRTELLGMTVWEVDSSLDVERARGMWAGIAPGGSYELFSEHRRRDGTTFPVEVHISCFAVQGERQYLALVRDITERRRTEAALRESESKYRIVSDNTFDWEFWIGADGRYLYTSPSCERIVGHRPGEFEADPGLMERIVHPDDLAEFRRHAGTALEGHRDSELEFRVIRPDGAVRWIGHICAPIHGEDGEFLGIRGSNRDITERKQAERALREGEIRFRALIENAPDGIVLCSREGRLTYASPAACRMFGMEVERLPEVDPSARTHSEDLPVVMAALGAVLGNPAEVRTAEYRFQHADGSYLWIESTFTNLVGMPGVDAIIINFRNIEDRKRAEAALRKSETLLREMGRVAKVGGWEFDVRTGEGVWTEEVARIHDVDPATPTNKLMGLSFYPGEARVRIEAAVQRAIERAEPYALEVEFVSAKGTPKWVYTIGQPVVENGRVVRLRGAFQDVTERRRAEEALAVEATRRRILVEGSRDGIVVLDREGKVVEANRRFAEMLGYTADEAKELHVWDWDRDWPRERVLEAIRDLGPEGSRFETRHWRRDGTAVPVELANSTAELGGQKLVFCVCHDITERKRAEEQLARDALRTEFLLELHQRAPQLTDWELYDHVLERGVRLTDSAVGVWHLIGEDQESIVVSAWNQDGIRCGTTAFDERRRVGESGDWARCVRERRPLVLNHYAEPADASGNPGGLPRLRRFMGVPVLQEGRVRLVFGVGNKSGDYGETDLAQLQLVSNELHKVLVQRSAENQLRQSEQRFRHLVETTFDWIWEVDTQGRYTYASPKVQDLLGYTPEEVVGHTPFDLMLPSEAARLRSTFQEIVARRESFASLENINRHKDGRHVVLESSGVPVLGDHGELVGYRGMDRDVTERKRLETQLRQAQKLEAIGQLAGGVAHDFNNILAAILMQLGLLQLSGTLDEETSQGLKDLEAEARRAAALTRQLLMFSRRSVLEVKPLDLNDVVRDLLKMLGRLIGEHVKLLFDGFTGAMPAVMADAGMLEQLLMNLVVNARDAMPRGGSITIGTSVEQVGELELQRHADRRLGCFVCLTVSDTGVGMSPEILERIFEPFFTTKEPGRGTGLGLATVHGIVAQHKGWVEVESEEGRGSAFRVYLPAVAQAPVSAAAEARPEPLRRGRETILLVEDETRVRRTVGQTLVGLGYRVFEAENGQQAMVLWQKHGADVDLLFTDMVMPEGMTGLELAERLMGAKPQLKVVISSGYSAEIVQSGGIKQAGIVYLPKPYRTQTLAETIRACLDRS